MIEASAWGSVTISASFHRNLRRTTPPSLVGPRDEFIFQRGVTSAGPGSSVMPQKWPMRPPLSALLRAKLNRWRCAPRSPTRQASGVHLSPDKTSRWQLTVVVGPLEQHFVEVGAQALEQVPNHRVCLFPGPGNLIHVADGAPVMHVVHGSCQGWPDNPGLR
jgi:hypothetical protein